METISFDPQVLWIIAGLLGSGVIALIRKWSPKLDVADKWKKQVVAGAYAALVCIAWPLLTKQAIPSINELLVQMLSTFTAALATYSVAKAYKESRTGGGAVAIAGEPLVDVDAKIVAVVDAKLSEFSKDVVRSLKEKADVAVAKKEPKGHKIPDIVMEAEEE